MGYAQDHAWEQQTAPLFIDVLRQTFHGVIRPASHDDDTLHGTDFLWTRTGGRVFTLAMRVREAAFLRYKDDFTIREDRPHSGHTTELEKIRSGDWAQFYAYGFSDGQKILHWSLFCMSHFNPDTPFQYMPFFGPRDNNDTVTRIYRISGQPEGFRIKSMSPRPIPQHQDYKRIAA